MPEVQNVFKSPVSLNLPINGVSFGAVSTAILRELYKSLCSAASSVQDSSGGIYSPNLFPVGQIDLSSQRPDEQFAKWIGGLLESSVIKASRNDPCFKLWHMNGGIESFSSNDRRLITFHECNCLTSAEVNVLNNQDVVYVTSQYTKDVFETFGVTVPVKYVKLGFDNHNFKVLSTRPTINGVVTFGMFGKWEKRKSHEQMLRAWVKKYGNNKRYKLNCSIINPFLRPEDQNALINRALEGKRYWNVNFLPYSKTNEEYNSVLQASDIILCCSACEGFDLPCYHSTAMGAWPVVLDAHVYPDYLKDGCNAAFVKPSDTMIKADDGMFFHYGRGNFNQGYWHTFTDDAFLDGCDRAETLFLTEGLNKKGMELQNRTFEHVTKELFGDLVY